MKSELDYVICATLFLFTTGVTGRITNTPLNTVVEVGGQAIFSCTSDITVQNWVFSRTREELEASTGQSIVANCAVQAGFTTHYDVDRSGGSNICNLIVKASTLQQSGVYTCSDTVAGPSAILTVINRDSSITVSSQPETVAGDQVTMSYAVRYSTSTASSKTPTIQPVLTWIDSDGNIVTSSPSSTANAVTSTKSVTAGRQDIPPYTCRTYFEIIWPSPSTGLSFANNTPNSVSNSPTTLTINVFYTPIISSITPSQEVPVCPGKPVKITCHATANPAPTFFWIGPDSRTHSGATIESAVNGTYTCNASNVIRGSTRSDMKESTLDVSEDTSKIKKCTPHPDNQWVIIVCIVIGAYILGNIIATVVFLVYCNRNIVFKLKFNDRFSWLRKMLPCMNENVACGCGWIFLSVFVFGLIGILFISWMVVIVKCSPGRIRSEATAKHFHNPSSTLGPNGDDTYEQINDGRHRVSQDNSKKGKDKKKKQNGKENAKSKSADKKKTQSPPSADIVSTTPPSPPPNQQSTTAQGTVYSDLPVTNHNVKPEQYIEGNVDNNYSELNKT